ncbi:hypothetical protein CRV08_12680 [Halarcobacter ebronensis]|uniref:Uncharacterized protein n=2 Tax=Halarcobacter ebronensis TaxID=1462615 RepID=A0A4V1LR00_9BACT|nr:hypothetical protein CRV08_12680 [Halarcobacter ebronensis]
MVLFINFFKRREMRLLFILLFLNINILMAQTISINVICEDKQIYPYILEDTKIAKNSPGITIEILKSLEKELNVKFKFNRVQSLRAHKILHSNQADMLLFASYLKNREEIGVYPKNSLNELNNNLKAMDLSYVLYTLKDSNLNWDGKNFINLYGKIGATQGYSIVDFLKNNNVLVSENSSNLGDVRKLIAKRIQGFVNQESKIDPYLKKNPKYAEVIKKIEIPIVTKPYFIVFSHKFYKKNSALADKIWALLADHKNNPKYKSIIKKYE